MTKDEALKMAIETFVRWEDTYKSDCTEVINACKEALERPSNMVAVPLDKLQDMQRRLKSLEQPSQEPVAWMAVDEISGEYMLEKEKDNGIEWTPLYASPQAREWVGLSDDEMKSFMEVWGITKMAIQDLEAEIKAKNT